jgi:hypothetical protein
LELASRACAESNQTVAGDLDTLAAAQAECGRFEHAIEAAHKARDIAKADGDSQLVEVIESHIRTLNQRRPIRIQPSEERPNQ